MRLVKALDLADRLEVAPFQDPAGLARAGLTPEQGSQAAWLVTADGSRYRGAAAFWAALAAIWPVAGDLFLAFYYLPGSRTFQDAIYRWVAANRGRLPSGPPYLSGEEGETADE